MEHIAAFLLIIGCSEDLTACHELPAPEPVFESFEDCEAELPYSFGDFLDRHPQLFAKCFEVDPMLAETDAEIVWEITAEGHLMASVEPIGGQEVLVASSGDRNPGETVTRQ